MILLLKRRPLMPEPVHPIIPPIDPVHPIVTPFNFGTGLTVTVGTGTQAQTIDVVGPGAVSLLGLTLNAIFGAKPQPALTCICQEAQVLAAQFVGKVQCNGDHEVTGKITAGGLTGVGGGALPITGDAHVSGTLNVVQDIILAAAAGDCAEDFDVEPTYNLEPGMVMVLDDSGSLRPSEQDYDRRVAGVISGAGDYRPGIILDRRES
jgi:hypothetical protein